jgi:hypothetical protein
VLQKVADDKELVVRQAVSRALRASRHEHRDAEPAPERTPSQDGALRAAGRGLLLDLYAALRSLKLYPVENATVQTALDDLQKTTDGILRTETEVEIRLSGDFIFINQTRLRLELDNYASFSQILAQFRAYEIGVIRVHPGIERREWQAFLSMLLSLQARSGAEGVYEDVRNRLDGAGVTHLEIEPAQPSEENLEDQERLKEVPSAPTRRAWR